MTKEFIRKPTIFPLETELPWNIVDNLCTIISHIITRPIIKPCYT